MFSCHRCLASALRAVAPDAAVSSQRLAASRSGSLRQLSTTGSRAITNAATASSAAAVTAVGRDGERSKKASTSDGGSYAGKEVSQYRDRNLRKELDWLKDPLKFADNVKDLLRKDQVDKALQLVRLGGRGGQSVVVAWNHLINHAMGTGNAESAWKMFNEMKKRAQKPDAYTFGIMLRGYAENAGQAGAVGRAITVYQSMFAPNSPVMPSLKHTNAVLAVCAKAKQLDSMFEIAAKLPSSGRGAADVVTFTTILHALRTDATDTILRFGDDAHATQEKLETAVRQGKRIWRDVISRWNDGDLMLDEELVCAMGRLLLISGVENNRTRNPRHADDILSLLEQAMGVPRQVAKLSWKARAALTDGSDARINELASQPAEGGSMQSLDRGGFDADDAPETSQRHDFVREDEDSVFEAVRWNNNSRPQSFARPGNDALSLAVTTCGSLKEYAAASAYWNLMKDVVQPDRENCHAYLRVLRLQRASRHSLVIVKQMSIPTDNGGLGVGVENKTFRIAISACVRDSKNPHVLDTALEMVNIMQRSLQTPDIQTLTRFADLLKARGRDADVRASMGAIEVLHSHLATLRNAFLFGDFDETEKRTHVIGQFARRKVARSTRAYSPNSLHPSSKDAIMDLARVIESATARALDHYREEISTPTKRRWHEKLQTLRKISRPVHGRKAGGPEPRREEVPAAEQV